MSGNHIEKMEKIRLKIDAAHRLVEQINFVRKLFWLAVLVVGSSLCVALINEHARYQVMSTYRLVEEQQAVLPPVTICNINQFTTDYARQFVSLLNNYSPLKEIVASSKQDFGLLDPGIGLLDLFDYFVAGVIFFRSFDGNKFKIKFLSVS